MRRDTPRSKLVGLYVSTICKEDPSEDIFDIYNKFNKAVDSKKPVIWIKCPHVAAVIKKWIVQGERMKTVGTLMSLSSLGFNYFEHHKMSVALSAGGFLTQSYYGYGWSRDSISEYVLQPLDHKPINKDAVLPEQVILVRKPASTSSFMVRGAVTFAAVAVSAYYFWKSLE